MPMRVNVARLRTNAVIGMSTKRDAHTSVDERKFVGTSHTFAFVLDVRVPPCTPQRPRPRCGYVIAWETRSRGENEVNQLETARFRTHPHPRNATANSRNVIRCVPVQAASGNVCAAYVRISGSPAATTNAMTSGAGSFDGAPLAQLMSTVRSTTCAPSSRTRFASRFSASRVISFPDASYVLSNVPRITARSRRSRSEIGETSPDARSSWGSVDNAGCVGRIVRRRESDNQHPYPAAGKLRRRSPTPSHLSRKRAKGKRDAARRWAKGASLKK